MSAAPDANADDDGFDPNALLERFSERLRELDQPVDLSISLHALQARRAVPTTPSKPKTPAPRSQLRPGRWNMDDVTDVEDQSERRRAQAVRALEQSRLAAQASAELALQREREARAQRQRDAAAAAERRAVEAQARAALLAQQRAEREAALNLAAERAAAEQAAAEQTAALRRRQQHEAAERAQAQRAADALAAELRLDFSASLPAAANEAELIASITLPRVPPATNASLPELRLPACAPAAPLDLDELGGLLRQLAREAAALARPAQDPTLGQPGR